MPRGWHELTPRQMRYLYSLLAAEFSATEIMAHCLLRWNGAKILGRRPSGAWLLRLGKISFSVSAEELAALYPMSAWLTTLPEYPVRPERIGRRRALPADMQGCPSRPLSSSIICIRAIFRHAVRTCSTLWPRCFIREPHPGPAASSQLAESRYILLGGRTKIHACRQVFSLPASLCGRRPSRSRHSGPGAEHERSDTRPDKGGHYQGGTRVIARYSPCSD